MSREIRLAAATPADVPRILELICALAEYERMTDQVVATEERVRESLFGAQPQAECVIAWADAPAGDPVADDPAGPTLSGRPREAVGFALWFHNYSTFLARPGLYLEDLFVLPAWRGRGVGRALLTHLARIAVERACGRMEWSVLDWNEPAIAFYRRLGAEPMDGWTVFRLAGSALSRLAGKEHL